MALKKKKNYIWEDQEPVETVRHIHLSSYLTQHPLPLLIDSAGLRNDLKCDIIFLRQLQE
jgi:hypothetical protein